MKKMRAKLKRLHSPDVSDLESFRPSDAEDFCVLIQAMFGPENSEGEESFDFLLCTPQWLVRKMKEEAVLPGRHYLFIKQYDINAVKKYLVGYVGQCEGDTWNEIAQKLARIGKWEFEDYRR